MKTRQRFILDRPLHQPDPRLQAPLDFTPPQPAEVELTIEERFRRFHDANPDIYRRLLNMALWYAQNGSRRISVKLLIEQLRAETPATMTDEAYRINNVFTSRYARMLAGEYELAGRIELRQLKAE